MRPKCLTSYIRQLDAGHTYHIQKCNKGKTMETNISESLINTIKEREKSINNSKIEIIKQWISQGADLLKLQEQLQCSQNDLTKITGVSKGTVSIYVQFSKDPRFLDWIRGDHHSGQLENFNQKQLLQLSKLNDSAFEVSINTGVIVSAPKEQVIDAEIIESSTNDKTHKIEESIRKLKMDLLALKKELPGKNKWGLKPVVQINLKGEAIAQYPSARRAELMTGILKTSIGNVCRGGAKSAGGYRWEFIALF